MRFLFVAFMACLAVSALAARSFTPEDNAAFSKDYNICKKASESAAPGGWSFMTEAEVKKNKASDKLFRFGSSIEMALQKHAQAKAKSGDIGDIGYECKDKKTTLHKIQVACDQIVAGTNYEYGAIAFVKCKGKWAGTRMHTFTGKFTVPV